LGGALASLRRDGGTLREKHAGQVGWLVALVEGNLSFLASRAAW